MAEKLVVYKKNDVHLIISCEDWMAFELSDYFKFRVPGAHFIPSVRNKTWDGYIRLFDRRDNTLYCGLLPYVEKFAVDREYEITLDKSIEPAEEFSVKEAKDFLDTLNLPMKPRDYQVKNFVDAVRNRRNLFVSPTASGKSLVIYMLTRFYDTKTLIIVPTTSLVSQMSTDFAEYAKNIDWPDEDLIHQITAGADKTSTKPIVISTWQSIYKLKKNSFPDYNLVFGDEAHLFTAKSLTSIMEKLEDCPYRYGMTGTLDGTKTHKLVLEGLFGPVKEVATTKELIKQKHLSDFRIKCLVLNYDEEVCRGLRKSTYKEEMDFLVGHPGRNAFIRNLTLSLEGNTLLLFQYVDKHGRILHDLIEEKNDDSSRKLWFVYSGTSKEDREQIRKITETERNAIIVASFGTFSTGINIRNLHNIIFASPTKSRIRNLQSIGRGLRKGDQKTMATLFDISDDLSIKKHKNYTLKHFIERVGIYNGEQFNYRMYKVKMK